MAIVPVPSRGGWGGGGGTLLMWCGPWSLRLGTLEIANEKLSNLNSLSEENYQRMSQEFRQNTRTLAEVKRELDSVFRRIRCEHRRTPSHHQGKFPFVS